MVFQHQLVERIASALAVEAIVQPVRFHRPSCLHHGMMGGMRSRDVRVSAIELQRARRFRRQLRRFLARTHEVASGADLTSSRQRAASRRRARSWP
jgi:hypothetical protein